MTPSRRAGLVPHTRKLVSAPHVILPIMLLDKARFQAQRDAAKRSGAVQAKYYLPCGSYSGG